MRLLSRLRGDPLPPAAPLRDPFTVPVRGRGALTINGNELRDSHLRTFLEDVFKSAGLDDPLVQNDPDPGLSFGERPVLDPPSYLAVRTRSRVTTYSQPVSSRTTMLSPGLALRTAES
jgi:hypothetical protein